MKVKIYVIGFDVSSNDAAQLRKIAEAGGGQYFDAKNEADIVNHFNNLRDAYFKNFQSGSCYYDAALKSNLCDSEMMLKCQNALFKALDTEPNSSAPEKLKARQELSDRISVATKERYERNQKLMERGSQLYDKMHENNNKAVQDYEKLSRSRVLSKKRRNLPLPNLSNLRSSPKMTNGDFFHLYNFLWQKSSLSARVCPVRCSPFISPNAASASTSTSRAAICAQ